MPVVCPICKSLAQQLRGTGYATAFRCVVHNHFKVADTVSERAEVYTREQWEIALRKAKQRATPGNDGASAWSVSLKITFHGRNMGATGTNKS